MSEPAVPEPTPEPEPTPFVSTLPGVIGRIEEALVNGQRYEADWSDQDLVALFGEVAPSFIGQIELPAGAKVKEVGDPIVMIAANDIAFLQCCSTNFVVTSTPTNPDTVHGIS